MRKLLIILLCLLMPYSSLADSFRIAPYSPDILEVASNRHTQMDEGGEVQPFLDTEGFELAAESDTAQLYLNKEYHTLRLLDKRTGYVWGAIPLTDARNLNASWKSYAASIVAIECFDKKNNEKRYGMAEETVQTAYTMVENGFRCHVRFTALGIEMTVSVLLDGNQLSLRIEQESILETGDFRLKSIAFMPYLGSVYEDEAKGWFLLPDGAGALMRFQKSGSYVAGYDKRIYGGDFAVSTAADTQADDYVRPEAQVLLPVYGIVHGVGQNGLLCVVSDGELYASIVATPAGLGNTKYNSIMTRFEMRQKYNMSTTQSGAGAAVPQENMNALSPTLTFHLLAGDQADYDQMAVYYRDLLQLQPAAAKGAGMRVEVLCGDFKDSYIPGATATLTTLLEAQEIARQLQADGIADVLFILSHYTAKNKAGAALSTGSMAQLSLLRDTVEQGGGSFCLGLDPVRANEDQINLRLQAANGMSLSPITLKRNNLLLLYPKTYFFRPAHIQRQVEEAQTRYAGYSFAADQLAFRLYGDYTTGQEITRKESAALMEEIAKQLPAQALYTPNQMMWNLTQAFLDMPLVNGQYLYETDTMPFLPIVLSGSLSLYAPALNLGTFSRDRMLRLLEYGAYPSFTVTACDSSLLAETSLSDYYSTCYADWQDFMLETWEYMKPAMDVTGGRAILAHTLMAQGKVRVLFEGNHMLYVNYTDEPWDTGKGTVQPHDYLIWEVTS